jgi:hypothetical protein
MLFALNACAKAYKWSRLPVKHCESNCTFSTLIYSFKAIAQAFYRSYRFNRSCLIESEWAFMAQNALQLLV